MLSCLFSLSTITISFKIAFSADCILRCLFDLEVFISNMFHNVIKKLSCSTYDFWFIRKHHQSIFIFSLSSPIQKKSFRTFSIALLQNMRINAQLFVITLETHVVRLWTRLAFEIQ